MKRLKQIIGSVSAGAFALVLAAAPVSAATVAVNDLNTDGWEVYQRDSGTAEISSEFGSSAGFGEDALVLKTPLDNDKAQVMRTTSEAMPLSTFTASYNTYRSSASADTAVEGQAPSINVEVDVNGLETEGGFTTLVYEPIYQEGGATAVQEDTWQNWTAGDDSIWWSTNPITGALDRDTFVTLASIKAQNNAAVVLRYGVNQGGGNAGLVGAVDGFVVNGTTYDFEAPSQEPEEPEMPQTKDDCKKDGWRLYEVFKNQGDCVSWVATGGVNLSWY